MTMPVSHVTIRVPLTIRRRPGRKTMVSLGFGADSGRIATKADPALVKALARAFRYQKLLDEGRYASISEMAAAEKIERGYLGRTLLLTLVAPTVINELLRGPSFEASTSKLQSIATLPWNEQEAAIWLNPKPTRTKT